MNKLIITVPAKLDLKEITLYHNKHSKTYSKLLKKQLQTNMKNLLTYPNLGKQFKQLREICYGNYRIIYTKIKNNIYIVRIIHCSMDFN